MLLTDLICNKIFERMQQQLELKYKSGEYKLPPKDNPIEIDPESKLNFVAFGDSQISNYMYARECCFNLGCADISNMNGKLDAIVICGDVTENGLRSEYRMTAKLLNGISDKFDNFLAMPGNHDVRFRRYQKQLQRFSDFVASVNNSVKLNGSYHFSTEIKGYKFIVMGTDKTTFEGAYISPDQLNWLDSELTEADKAGKPVFLFNHQPLKKTNGLPNNWNGFGTWRGSVGNESDKLKAILEKHSNVYFITGHLHWCTNAHSVEDHGAYKAVSVQTISAGNHGDYGLDAQGFVFTVYEDRVVIRARVFGEGRYVEDTIPCHEVTFRI